MAKEILGSIGPVVQLILELLKMMNPADADIIGGQLEKIRKENHEKFERAKQALVPPFDIPALNSLIDDLLGH